MITEYAHFIWPIFKIVIGRFIELFKGREESVALGIKESFES